MWPRKKEAQIGMQLQTIPALNSVELRILDIGVIRSIRWTCANI